MSNYVPAPGLALAGTGAFAVFSGVRSLASGAGEVSQEQMQQVAYHWPTILALVSAGVFLIGVVRAAFKVRGWLEQAIASGIKPLHAKLEEHVARETHWQYGINNRIDRVDNSVKSVGLELATIRGRLSMETSNG